MPVIVVVIVALIIGVGVVTLAPWKARVRPAVTQTQTEAAKEAAQAAEKKAVAASRSKSARKGTQPAKIEIPPFPELPKGLTVTAAEIAKTAPPPFPEPDDLRAGMHRTRLKALYGNPAFITTQIANGRLYERYVYVDRDKSSVTIGIFENGRLVRSSSATN